MFTLNIISISVFKEVGLPGGPRMSGSVRKFVVRIQEVLGRGDLTQASLGAFKRVKAYEHFQ